jgi:branched-chain amino acid transport system substrate-binding protein
MHKVRIASVVLPLIVGAITGCGNKEILIGGLAPLSVQGVYAGISSEHGFELAFDECNAKGGINGHPVKLLLTDDQGDELATINAIRRFITRDKVVGVLGPLWGGTAVSGGKICQQAKVPMVATTATAPMVTQVGDYIFRACYTDPCQGTVGAKFAFETLKARNVACIYQKTFSTTAGFQAAAKTFEDRFTSLGGKVASESFGTNAVDPSTLLDRLLPGKPDLLYLPVWGDVAASLAKKAREKGYTGPILGTDAWDYQDLVKVAGPAVEGSYFTNHFSTGDSRPEVQDFVKKYVGRFGVEPDSCAVMAYDASRLLFDSIRRAGSTSHDAVRDALKTADFPAVSGRVKFDEFRNPVKPVVIVQVQSGKFAYNSTMMP